LDLGFQQALNAIVESLPKERQTLLFSATQTRSVQDLARLSLESPVFVSVHENSAATTPDNLTQSYIVTDLDNKINILWSFLKSHRKKKTLVFLQSCKQVKYINEIFCRLRPGLSVLALYGTLHQLKRMNIYDQFCNKESAVLFATDIAARGLDFPAVDWVVQLDCPEDATTYVHRVGRTARYDTGGESLLMLLPSEEEGMMKQIKANKIPISKIEINPNKMFGIEKKMAAHLASDNNLKESAQRAFQSYIKSVYLMKNKKVFDAHKIDTDKFAESLGLAVAPRVRFLDKQKKLKAAQKANKLENDTKGKSVNDSKDEHVTTSKEEVPTKSKSKEVVTTKVVDESEEESDEEVDEPKKEKVDDDKIRFDDSDDDSDEDIFTVKRTNVQIKDDDNNEQSSDSEPLEQNLKTKGSGLSKVQMAKKMLKKQIVPNSKVNFDEEGDVLGDSNKTKVSKEGQLYEAEEGEEGGINIERAKAVMKAEDQFDKVAERRRHKEIRQEKKRKEKEARKRKRDDEEEGEEEGESDSGEEVDLSWLPDPDKVYGDKKDESDAEKSDEEDTDEDMDTEVVDTAQKVTVIRKKIPKRRKVDDDDDEVVLDTGLSLEDDEDLALQLLKR